MKTYKQEKNIYLDRIELDALLSDRNEYENYLLDVIELELHLEKYED